MQFRTQIREALRRPSSGEALLGKTARNAHPLFSQLVSAAGLPSHPVPPPCPFLTLPLSSSPSLCLLGVPQHLVCRVHVHLPSIRAEAQHWYCIHVCTVVQTYTRLIMKPSMLGCLLQSRMGRLHLAVAELDGERERERGRSCPWYQNLAAAT